MALTWDATKVTDWKKKTGAVADTMIWMTMFVGMNEITEKNAEEFYARIQLLEKLFGAYLNQTDTETKVTEPKYITFDDVKSFIGLTTNASTLTRNQFNKRQMDRYYRDAFDSRLK